MIKPTQISIERPEWVIDLLKKYPQLDDFTVRYTDEDKDVPCFFAEEKSSSYHPHEFTIRMNGNRIWICKEHLRFISELFKEFLQ